MNKKELAFGGMSEYLLKRIDTINSHLLDIETRLEKVEEELKYRKIPFSEVRYK